MYKYEDLLRVWNNTDYEDIYITFRNKRYRVASINTLWDKVELVDLEGNDSWALGCQLDRIDNIEIIG